MKKIIQSIILSSALFAFTYAGWSAYVHKNLLYEAIRILPAFDYEMCVFYQGDLLKGIVEGEIQFKYKDKGRVPLWVTGAASEEADYLNGIPVDKNNYQKAALFYSEKIIELKKDIQQMRRKYSDVLFELGYLLAGLNNTLIPLYEKGNMGEQHLAADTGELALRTDKIINIENIHEWMKSALAANIKLRDEWSLLGEQGDRDKFKDMTMKACEMSIYNNAAILEFALSDCFGPGHPEARKHVEEMHERRFNAQGGRKPELK